MGTRAAKRRSVSPRERPGNQVREEVLITTDPTPRTGRLSLRIAVAFTTLLVLAAALPSTALAWANGPSGPDGFGTHDWVLHQANKHAASAGADWLDFSVAQPVTDDPDTVYFDHYHHAYDVWGEHYGDAPSHIGHVYATAVRQLRSGDTTSASRTLGLVSHYYSDVCNPLHTDKSDAERGMHLSYEMAVDLLTDEPGENAEWVSSDGAKYRADVVGMTRSVAASAHEYYGALVSQYTESGISAVQTITATSLDRAVNGVADLIFSAQTASQLTAGSVYADMSSHQPPRFTSVTAKAKVTDPAGRPIPGAQVRFVWQFRTVTRTNAAYTGANGIAYARRYISRATPGYKVRLSATSSVNGATRSGSTWFVPR